MSNETLFYVCGGVLAVSALVVTFAGLKVKGFPGRAFPLVIIWFAVFVVGATTFAVRYSAEEQEERALELEQAGEEIEEAESTGGFENEGGALGGETEEGEEEAEEAEEGPEGEEPVGPTVDSKEDEGAAGKGGVTKGEEGSKGTEGSSSGAEASTTLQLAADPTDLAYDKSLLSASPGTVTIEFTNPSAIPHNVVIEKEGEEIAGFEPIVEGEESVSADLEAHTFYTFLCTVPGHAEAGMEGELVVK
ncbi:MAG TPA: plastocyanin/azurin family copper-binding protein [Solirubrobacterales bacterium]|nr:plastocyanin/azurin family copper-binding protein [Solirubrobacterales bacterium]